MVTLFSWVRAGFRPTLAYGDGLGLGQGAGGVADCRTHYPQPSPTPMLLPGHTVAQSQHQPSEGLMPKRDYLRLRYLQQRLEEIMDELDDFDLGEISQSLDACVISPLEDVIAEQFEDEKEDEEEEAA